MALVEAESTLQFSINGVGGVQSRVKRSEDTIEPRYLIGVDERLLSEKVLSGSGSWADGKSCTSGQDPLNEQEAKLARDEFNRKSGDNGYVVYQTGVHKKIVLGGTPGPLDYQKNCGSKVCSYDLERMSLICGHLQPPNYKNGQSCIDGSIPKKEKEYKKPA